MSRVLAGLYTDAADALDAGDIAKAVPLLRRISDDLAAARDAPTMALCEDAENLVAFAPAMASRELRKAANELRAVAADLAEAARDES